MWHQMVVISNPLGFGHLLPLLFFLPDVEELWTAALQSLPAAWPIIRSISHHLSWNVKGGITYCLLFYFSLWKNGIGTLLRLGCFITSWETEEVTIESYGKFMNLERTIGSLTENVVHPIMIMFVTGNSQSSCRYLINFICIQRM